jgi:hypothetical protein
LQLSSGVSQQPDSRGRESDGDPLACTLGGADLRCRADDLLPGLAALAHERTALPEGWRLAFRPTPECLRRVADVIERERHCCAFLHFELTVPPGGAPFVLTVTGPPGTGASLAGLPEASTPPSAG